MLSFGRMYFGRTSSSSPNCSIRQRVVAWARNKPSSILRLMASRVPRTFEKLYTTEALRDTGTYFTGSSLANRLVGPLAKILPNAKQVVDPACGAGDLLVACARHFPLRKRTSPKLCVDMGGWQATCRLSMSIPRSLRRLDIGWLFSQSERTRTRADQICCELPLALKFSVESNIDRAWPSGAFRNSFGDRC